MESPVNQLVIMHAAALNALAIGIVVCDAEARLLFANAAARELARRGTGITLSARAKVVGTLAPAEGRALAQLISDAARGGHCGAIRLTGRDGVTALPVLITPLARRANGTHGGYALLCTRTVADQPPATEKTLADLFHLSPTQASIAMAIFDGKAPEEVARTRGVKISTLRTHLADIFLRTGTETQRDLIRLIGALPPLRSLRHSENK
jgi:DNA-binding CsgD family transcriptional regulator